MDLKGKTALVTGGASGIGLACVRELLRCGANVAICDLDDRQGATALTGITTEFGQGRAVFVKTDVCDETQFEEAFKFTQSTFKSLDIVLNNAGVSEISGWEKTIAVNLIGVVRGTQLALRYMTRDEGGRGGVICNTASVAGLMALPIMPVYCATKHAVIGLTRSYGSPLVSEGTGVRVVAVCPGSTDTPLMDAVKQAPKSDVDAANFNMLLTMSPLQKAEDVAIAVMVLLKTASSGTIWVSEGGEPVYELEIPEYQAMRKKQEITS